MKLILSHKKRIVGITLAIIVFFAFFLRIYQLDKIPPSLSWDEAAVGYNAYAIANYTYDEWGNLFPMVFKSFEDDKNPVHIYFTALSVKILGLSNFSVRLSAAIFGTLSVLIIFFLAQELFKKAEVGLIAALFLSISPYSLQFSRFNHEANFALFFFMFGLFLFLKGIRKRNYLLSLSFISFGLSLLSYHSSKVVVPVILIILTILYFKNLWKLKRYFITGILLLSIFLSIFLLNPVLLGTARIQQTAIPDDLIFKTQLYKNTHNKILGFAAVVTTNYLTHYSLDYLFNSGDKIPRHSIQTVGEFYKIDTIFLIIGLLGLVILRSKASIIVIAWALLAPIPAALSGGGQEVPHAARAMYMMGSWNLIAAYGYYEILYLLKNKWLKVFFYCASVVILGLMFKNYMYDYYNVYPKKYAIEWQYGMKQITDYIKNNPNYSQVYMTDVRHQPYIFFLYGLQTSLPEFVHTAVYNTGESRSYNLVSGYNQFHFGDWDPIESMPNGGVLYIVSPSEYDGLRFKAMFDVKKAVKYPNGESAFFIISAK